MRSNPLRRTIPSLLAVLLLAGCGTATAETPPASGATIPAGCPAEVLRDNVVLVVGTHANMPRPVLTPAGGSPTSPEATCALTHLLDVGGTLTVIGVDGDPQVTRQGFSSMSDEVRSDNHPARQRLMRNRWSELDQFLTLSAQSEGADLHRALELALRTTARTPEDSVVIVLDNGLSDRGVVDMTRPYWSTAEPRDIAAAVAQNGEDLQQSPGTTVVLSGLGIAVTAPQPQLSTVQERTVTEIWTTLLLDAGAVVTVDPEQWSSREGNPTDLQTGIVEPYKEPVPDPPPPPEEEDKGPIVLKPGSLNFEPDEADPEITDGALAHLETFARTQRGDERTQIYVIGRTDSTPTTRWADNNELSQARADSVRDVLVDFGADPDRIVSVGQGYAACPDDGGLDRIEPGLRAQNRVVIVGELERGQEIPSGCFLPPQQ